MIIFNYTSLKPVGFQQSFIKWVKDLQELSCGKLVAIDGKTVRQFVQTLIIFALHHTIFPWWNNCFHSRFFSMVDDSIRIIATIRTVSSFYRFTHDRYQDLNLNYPVWADFLGRTDNAGRLEVAGSLLFI